MDLAVCPFFGSLAHLPMMDYNVSKINWIDVFPISFGSEEVKEKIVRFRLKSLVLALVAVCLCPARAQNQQTSLSLEDFAWLYSPKTARVGTVAEQKIGTGFMFLEESDARRFIAAMENPPSHQQVGVIAPVGLQWFGVYSYDPIGYVKDDEKDALDSAKLLKALQEGDVEGNKERRRLGYPELHTIGWAREPHYDVRTHNLEWGVKLRGSNGEETVNYHTRFLGRGGVMSVILVCAPQELDAVLPSFKEGLTGFAYTTGNKYSEYRQGDRLADIGLTALIAGGAAAVAVKAGVFKWLWKVIVGVVIAVGALFKKIFGGAKGGGE